MFLMIIKANIRFAGVPVKVIECNNPWKSPIGKIPFLQAGAEHFFSPNDVSAYLRSKVCVSFPFPVHIDFRKIDKRNFIFHTEF